MTETPTKNAIIESVSLTADDHGVLTSYLTLDYGGSGQGFGGYCLYNPNFPTKGLAGKFIWRCMEIAGVTEWQKLIGKTIRVKAEHTGVTAIGHITRDIWFTPKEELR